jgi:hypothetical protein
MSEDSSAKARVTFEQLLPPRQANEIVELQLRHRTILYFWKRDFWKRAVDKIESTGISPEFVDTALTYAKDRRELEDIYEPFVDIPITPEELAAAIAAGGTSEIETILAAERRAVNTIEAEASAYMDAVGLGPLLILSEKEESKMWAEEFGEEWDEERFERRRDKYSFNWYDDEDNDDELPEGDR